MSEGIKKILKDPMDKISAFVKDVVASIPVIPGIGNKTTNKDVKINNPDDKKDIDKVDNVNQVATQSPEFSLTRLDIDAQKSVQTPRSSRSSRHSQSQSTQPSRRAQRRANSAYTAQNLSEEQLQHSLQMSSMQDEDTDPIQTTGQRRVFGSQQIQHTRQIEEVPLHDSPSESTTQVSEKELDQLLRDVRDIKDMSVDMADMLGTQKVNLDKIEQNIDSTDANLKYSDRELQQAIKYKKDGMNNVLGATTGAIAGSFFGPIGAVGGAIVGLSSTALYNHVR